MLKIKFIGTGSAKVSLKRNYTSLLFQTSAESILIDCGEGTSKALLQQNIELNAIDKIIISHLHPDHFAGLAGLLTNFKLEGRNKPVHIITHKSNLSFIKHFLLNSFIIPERMNFEIIFDEFDHAKEYVISKDLKFISLQNSHLDKYKIYAGNYDLSLASPSFLFTYSDKKIIYTSDIGATSDLLLFYEQVDILICEITHINISQIAEALKQLHPDKIYLIHIPDDKEDEINDFMASYLVEQFDITLAYEGLEITAF